MNVHAINAAYLKPTPASTSVALEKKTPKKPEGDCEISKLNGEIKQAEAERKEAMKEIQKATAESIDGSSDQVQLLQNKIAMQQQTIMMKQLQIKEMESPEAKPTDITSPRFDQVILKGEAEKEVDNVYRLEEKDGTRIVVFNRPADWNKAEPQ